MITVLNVCLLYHIIDGAYVDRDNPGISPCLAVAHGGEIQKVAGSIPLVVDTAVSVYECMHFAIMHHLNLVGLGKRSAHLRRNMAEEGSRRGHAGVTQGFVLSGATHRWAGEVTVKRSALGNVLLNIH